MQYPRRSDPLTHLDFTALTSRRSRKNLGDQVDLSKNIITWPPEWRLVCAANLFLKLIFERGARLVALFGTQDTTMRSSSTALA
jgi:hypothetical protein